MRDLLFIFSLFFCVQGYGQSSNYSTQKASSIEKGSVFTKIINRELPAIIVFEDDEIIAFIPLHPQASEYFMKVPKKKIYILNIIFKVIT